jgi:hypothetical protein
MNFPPGIGAGCLGGLRGLGVSCEAGRGIGSSVSFTSGIALAPRFQRILLPELVTWLLCVPARPLSPHLPV